MSKNEIMKNEKLKLEEIVGYLPYGLKVKVIDVPFYKYDIMTLCDKGGLSNIALSTFIDEPQDFKPILHPLKEIQNHIHKFSDKLCTYGSNDKFGGIDSASPEDYQLMYKLHLDVHNLIWRGLAIDINALKQ